MIPFVSTRPKPDITKLNPDSVLELHRMARCPTGITAGPQVISAHSLRSGSKAVYFDKQQLAEIEPALRHLALHLCADAKSDTGAVLDKFGDDNHDDRWSTGAEPLTMLVRLLIAAGLAKDVSDPADINKISVRLTL